MSEEEVFEDTPAARSALHVAFNTLKERRDADYWEDAVGSAMSELRLEDTDELTPKQKCVILCSALWAIQTLSESAKDVHPYSQPGFDLHEAVSMITWTAMRAAEKSAGLPEFALELPDWIET